MRQQHLIQVEETARKATSMARKAREEEEVTVTKRKAEDKEEEEMEAEWLIPRCFNHYKLRQTKEDDLEKK